MVPLQRACGREASTPSSAGRSARPDRSRSGRWPRYNDGTVLVCASESEGTPDRAGQVARALTDLPESGARTVLIAAFDADRIASRIAHLLPQGADVVTLDAIRLPDALLTNRARYLDKQNFATNFAFFREVLAARPAPPAARPDLSSAVTVFVTTVGSPTLDTCLAHLASRTVFALRVIDGVAPMDAAFQRMLDECTTPYYAGRRGHAAAPARGADAPRGDGGGGPEVAVSCAISTTCTSSAASLAKIFRHEIVRRYPFRAMEAFEVDQVERFEADGYTMVRSSQRATACRSYARHARHPMDTGGDLRTLRQSPAADARLSRPHGMVRRLRTDLRRRFLDDPSDLNALRCSDSWLARSPRPRAGPRTTARATPCWGSPTSAPGSMHSVATRRDGSDRTRTTRRPHHRSLGARFSPTRKLCASSFAADRDRDRYRYRNCAAK